jgi:hypothetical protein
MPDVGTGRILILNDSTETETDTVSTTVAVTMRKRQASSTDAANIFASVLSRPSTDIEFACSCLQTPTTTSITVTQTALSTTIITPIVSDDLTVTPFTTVQVTETDTITESVITTATSTLEASTTTTVTETSTVTETDTAVNSPTAICVRSAIPTSCDTGSSFVLMASSSDQRVNGKYGSLLGSRLSMNTPYSSAARFCIASNGDIKLFSSGRVGATVVDSTRSFFYTTRASNYGPPVCKVTFLDDCTEILQCSAADLVNQVVDPGYSNVAWLVSATGSGYNGITRPPPSISLIMQV